MVRIRGMRTTRMMKLLCIVMAFGGPVTSAGAQTQPSPPLAPAITADGRRPVPGPVYEIPEFTRAVDRGTRTRTGRPGSTYWVQHARYTIEVRLDVQTNRVSGSERAVYINDSPDTLRRIAVYLRQNVFAPGNPRRKPVAITGGVTLGRVAVAGRVITGTVDGTVMWIPLDAPLVPHDSTTLELSWSYVAPQSPADGREGREGHSVYFMGYWYPQVAVYDDVEGWVTDPYVLEAEFYMDPADYDVRITVPRGWVVGATGTLRNASEVLSPIARARLADARRTGHVVHIVEPGPSAASAFAGHGPTATWHFTATDVRDFAWGTSAQYVWDATRALVANDTVDINSFYRRSAPAAAWALGGARYTRDAIEQLSAYLWPYPWPVMTSMEGVLDDGGMEYPEITLISPWADTLSLAGDLMHETGHMWFPMQVGSNETRYPWMDEGFTQFDVAQAMRVLYAEPRAGGRPNDSEQGQRQLYLRAARAGHDMTLMWPGDMYPQDLYFTMFYNKTGQVLAALRGVIGEETFHRAFREYGRRWTGRHPYPYDFFNTMNDVAGRDLSWFWTTWLYEPWPLDQAIASVEPQGDSTAITIEDRGLAPMPVYVAVTRADGSVQRVDVPVDVWLTGTRRHVVRVASSPAVVSVDIDPDGLFPDMNRENQIWKR
jgi:Peptidase family M1 domain